MPLLTYIIIYPIFWFISILPFRLLYLLSDIAYLFVYRVLGYRKSVVRKNIKQALPHLDAGQRKLIEKKFYRHFCDTLFEMVKTMSISEDELKKRFTFENIELINEYEAKGKSVALVLTHYGNYEWLLVMNKYMTTHKGYGIYKIVRNKYLDALIRRIRGKLGSELVDTRQSVQLMIQNKRKGIPAFYGFISDQSPKLHSTIHWAKLFGAEVPVHVGAEILAKKLDMNVMFVKCAKIKRGYYRARFIAFDKNPKTVPDYEITDAFLRLLEEQILEAPEYYLWTHKRFKHRRNLPTTA